MNTQTNQPKKLRFNRTERTVLIVVVLALALGIFVMTARGTTFFNITLTNSTDLQTGLVGHWTFDGKDMQQGVEDISGNGNNGTLNGQTSTTTVIGRLGQALEFDGTDDYVDVDAAAADATGNFSMGAWIKTPNKYTSTTWGSIIGRNTSAGGNVVMLAVGDNVGGSALDNEFSVFDGSTSAFEGDTDTVIADDAWHHVFYVLSGSTGTLYVDGIEKSTHAADYTLASNDQISIAMEFDTSTPTDFVEGSIDDVRIYNRALSPREVEELYGLGATTHINTTLGDADTGSSLSSGLVGHWTFDGKDMQQGVEDVSGNGNNGTLTNFTSTTTVIGRMGQALSFDGSDDYVDLGDTYTTSLPLSFSAWVSLNALPGTFAGIMNTDETLSSAYNHSGAWMNIVNDGDISLGYGSNTACAPSGRRSKDGSTPLSTDQWYHVVGVIRGATDMNIYIDGVDIGGTYSGSGGSIAYAAGRNAGIGRSTECSNGNALPLDSIIDDVRIYNRALSPREVEELYGLGATTHINTTLGDTESGSGLSDGLVSHWTFDGKNMQQGIEDISGNSNNGTLNGQTSTTTAIGRLGQALKFDGSDDYIALGSGGGLHDLANSTFSASVWVKLSSTGDVKYIFDKKGNNNRGWFLRINAGGSVNFTCFGVASCNGTTSGTPILDTEWHHIVLTRNDSNYHIYVDGVDEFNTTLGVSPQAGTGGLTMGGQIPSSGFVPTTFDDYTIDDVRIYNRALSAEEVSRLYNLGR